MDIYDHFHIQQVQYDTMHESFLLFEHKFTNLTKIQKYFIFCLYVALELIQWYRYMYVPCQILSKKCMA